MEHDLLSKNILFDGDYTSKPDGKSVLVWELEKHFESRELNFENKSDLQTVLLVDFMSMIRRMSLSQLAVFEELFTAKSRKVKSIYSISQGAKRSVVISNDTDVFALLIHYLPDFSELGLQELWIMFGVGDKTRFLPLHLLLYKIGVPKCKVIYKAHILTGSDSTSKIGSKKSAINPSPELYLQRFGE